MLNLPFADRQERRWFVSLFVFGVLTLLLNVVKIFTVAPASQYVLLSVEMVAGLAVLFVPFLFTRFTGLVFPKLLRLYYWFFLWIAVFLGTGLRLIVVIPFWDKILHAVSPILLVAVGYGLIGYFLPAEMKHKVSPWLYIMMGFAFAGVCGVFWEFWEFACDSLGNMNLQRYMTEAGELYVGRAALMDTMGDLLTNTIGALLLTSYSIFQRKKTGYFEQFTLQKQTKKGSAE